ncbi:MAG: sulfate adenylyltransferase, partial [Alphaproteobacteria bacterium]|nr:sulfate adenylyltransferase [Alphaproteobacteria bacterium]
MAKLVPPHGSDNLVPLLLSEGARAEALGQAETLPRVPLTSREVSDLFMLGMGAYTPLDGFMGEADWRGVCRDMQLAGGLFWPIPITLSAERDTAGGIAIGEQIALADGESGTLLATMTVTEKYG